MGSHALWNLFNELGKSEKMQGLQSLLSFFRNQFNKFNKTGAQLIDSIYHMSLELFCNIFGVKMSTFC